MRLSVENNSLTFDMLECHPLVTDQVAYKFQWDKVDVLYEFVDRLPAWVVDDEIIDVWASGHEDDPQSFRGWEAKKVEWGQVLMLFWAPARIGGGARLPYGQSVHSCHCLHPPLPSSDEYQGCCPGLVGPCHSHTNQEHERPLSAA